MESKHPKPTLMSTWFDLMAILAGIIAKQKQKLIQANIVSGLFWTLGILVLELILGILSLPIYVFFDYTKHPTFFNQAGCSYSLYRMRRRLTISMLAPVFMMLAVYVYFSNASFASTPPIVNLTTQQQITQSDWSAGASTSSTVDALAYLDSVTVSTSGQISLGVSTDWYNSSWQYRRKITIQASQVSSTESNFPVLITGAHLTSTSFFSNINEDGSDIVFTASDGLTKLYREVVSVSTTEETMEAWVTIPTLSSSADTDIYVYYGNSGATETNDTEVWGSYAAVWHMEDDPSISSDGFCGGGSLEVCDATGYSNDADSFGDPTSTVGKIGNAVDFDGNDYLIAASDIGHELQPQSSDFSYSTWVRLNVSGGVPYVMGLGAQGSAESAVLRKRSSNASLVIIDGGSGNIVSTADGAAWSTTSWVFVAVTFDRDGNMQRYLNGVPDGVGDSITSVGSIDRAGGNFAIAADYQGNLPLNGKMDEVRMARTLLSTGWVKTEYNNQSSPTSFYTVATEETNASSPTGTIISNIFDVGNTSSVWGTINFNTDIASNTFVYVRTATTSDMSSAPDFATCDPIVIYTDISDNGCVSDNHRYMQYKVVITISNTTSPIFQDITIQSLSTSTITVGEDNGETTISATLDEVSGVDVTVPFTVAGTASISSDHDLVDGEIIISSGSLTGTTTFNISDDTTYEGDETIIVYLGTPTNGTVGSITSTFITITDNDSGPTVSLSASNSTISENGGTSLVKTTLSNPSAYPVTSTLVISGTASISDFSSSSLEIVVLPGSTSGTITITGIDDSIVEGTETVVIDIDTVTGTAATESGTQQVTINLSDDDTAGVSVSESDSATTVNEEGPTSDTYTIVLNTQPSSTVTIALAVSGSQIDISTSSIEFTSVNWSSPQTITVTAVDDSDIDSGSSNSDTITHTASSADSNYDGISVSNVSVTITDNDQPEPEPEPEPETPSSSGGGYAPGGSSFSRPTPQSPGQGFVIVPVNPPQVQAPTSAKTTREVPGNLPPGSLVPDLPPPSPKNYLTHLSILESKDRIVTLRFNASDNVNRMALSHSPSFLGVSQEPYRPVVEWDICPQPEKVCDNGSYFVYIKFYTEEGISSEIISQPINLKQENNISPIRIVKSDASPEIFIVENGLKRFIPDEETFYSLNFDWNKIEILSQREVINIPTGTDYESVKSNIINYDSREDEQVNSFDKKPQISNLPISSFASFLSIGSVGREVQALQIILESLGFFPEDTSITSYYGPVTRDSVIRFQSAYGVDPLGIVGPATRDVLNKIIAN